MDLVGARGRVYQPAWYIQAWESGAWIYVCVLIPLGSPTRVQKRVSAHPVSCSVEGAVRVGYQVGYTEVGTRGGYTGVVPSRQGRTRKGYPDSEAGPGSPCRGLEWVVRIARPRTSAPHPCGARSGPGPSLGAPRANAASGPIRAELRSYFYKVSQNHGVSPKSA